MASSALTSSSFPAVSMADDSMEISSDHGGLNANDDIDIDIDFMAGTADEDYMLEDPEPETDVEFKESFESAPQVINDDVMLDDYNASFQEDMQDVDERFQDIAEESVDLPEMEFSSSKGPELNGPDRRGSNTNVQGPVFNGTAQLQDSALGQSPVHLEDGSSQIGASHGSGTFEAQPSTDHHSPKLDSSVPDTVTISRNSPDSLANGATNHISSEQDTLDVESKEANIMHNNNTGISAEAVASQFSTDQGEKEALEDDSIEEQVQSDEMEASYAEIMVSYQDAQYTLFSTSDEQDTDSFFLKDRTIVHQPISIFLKALRGILQDELDGDHELCIAVDALRLEFGETSAEIENVTFKELVNLHQQLLRNDGVEEPEPMHFTLGTRPEFAKRFVGLLAGASEGKGLSELIPRDEVSESYDDAETSPHVEEPDTQYDQNGEESLFGDNYQYDVEENAQEHAEHDAQDEYHPEQDQDNVQDEHHSELDENEASTLELSEERVEREASLDISSIPQGSDGDTKDVPTQIAHGSEGDEPEHEQKIDTMTQAPTGDVDVPEPNKAPEGKDMEVSPEAVKEKHDEDDLIDYSDEEPDTKPKGKATLPTSRNASLEGNESEFRPQSPSRPTEHASGQAAVSATDADTTNSGNQAEDADEQKPIDNTYDDAEIDFDFEDDQNDQDNQQQEHAGEAQPTNNEPEADNFEEDQNDQDNQQQEHAGEAQPTNNEPEADNFEDYFTGFDEHEQGDETRDLEEEISYEDDLEIGGQDLTESGTQKITTSSEGEVTNPKSTGASPLDEVSAESVTVNGDTGDADEIDYDEDDLPTEVAKESVVSSAHDSQPIKSTETEVFDEIDYDDDDIGVVTPPPQIGSKLQPASSSTPGKRQRSDSMSEVAPGEGNQEAKRVRS